MEDEIGLWWGAVMSAAANFKLQGEGEEDQIDAVVWNIIEAKFPFETNSQLAKDNPLFHSVLNLLRAARCSTSSEQAYKMLLIDQSSKLLEHSSLYNECKQHQERTAQNSMVNMNFYLFEKNCYLVVEVGHYEGAL